MPAIADWLEAAKEKAERRDSFAQRFFTMGYDLTDYQKAGPWPCQVCDTASRRMYRIHGEDYIDGMSFVCDTCFREIEDDAWRIRDPWEAGRRIGERTAAARLRHQWRSVALWVGVAGFIVLVGTIVIPQTGEPTVAFLIGLFGYLGLLLAGLVFAVWCASWLLYRVYVRVRYRGAS